MKKKAAKGRRACNCLSVHSVSIPGGCGNKIYKEDIEGEADSLFVIPMQKQRVDAGPFATGEIIDYGASLHVVLADVFYRKPNSVFVGLHKLLSSPTYRATKPTITDSCRYDVLALLTPELQ